jgi:hypothetical protein
MLCAVDGADGDAQKPGNLFDTNGAVVLFFLHGESMVNGWLGLVGPRLSEWFWRSGLPPAIGPRPVGETEEMTRMKT